MKTKAEFLSLALILTSLVSLSQVKEKSSDQSFKKNLIGIQYNPQYNGNKLITGNLYSIRLWTNPAQVNLLIVKNL